MMGGGGGMDIISKLLQTVQPQPQQSEGADQCSQGGGKNPAEMFQQILQQFTPGG
jgi:hypothetical protein